MPSPRAFSSRKSEPFDWPLFLRRFPFQPVPLWLLLNALAGPLARAFPALTRAACQGTLRASLTSAELVVYTAAVPAAVTTAFYLAVGRRRIEKKDHRLIADMTFGLMLALSVVDGGLLAARIHAQWPVLRPGLTAIRAACWP
ncbi:MAG: hypothetical protein KGL74_02460 [Elusimicrobia bacterium]|nr:hypothetical protein [Elusimicrobiota bacterium]MDE2509963.1 hypothetical protein [Elusimicrobiota bacterium]